MARSTARERRMERRAVRAAERQAKAAERQIPPPRASDELAEVRAAIRRLRQANVAGVLKDSSHRDAGHAEAEWSRLAPYADEPPA